jgi:hypothetical protein
MASRVHCRQCGDNNYATDPVCLSCGADLAEPASHSEACPDPEPLVVPAEEDDDSPVLADLTRNSPLVRARRERLALEHTRARRARRIEELKVQVDTLIQQGYHKLPTPADERYGPADDVSDLCREIGECYARNAEDPQAVRWFERAVVIAPANTVARAYLVGALCRLGQYAEAQVWCDDTPGDPIDRNVVAAWLELPDEEATDASTWASVAEIRSRRHCRTETDERVLHIKLDPRPAVAR